jgi:lactate dehydrogenase-like 2-hydroxyacid dehydrogenase
MTIGVLALVGVTPERVAALTAAGYAVREGKTYANRTDAVREAADTVRAVLTNGRGGLSGDEMAWLPKLEIICAVGAGYEAVDLDTARRRGIVVAHCPDANAPAVADSAMLLLLAATRYLLRADRVVRAGGWQVVPPARPMGSPALVRRGSGPDPSLSKASVMLAALAPPWGPY